MKIQYVGPRPEISKLGVCFKSGKDDKYVYLVYAVDILLALDTIHHEKKYVHPAPISFKPLSEDQIYQAIQKYEPNIEQHVDEEIKSYIHHLQREIDEVKETTTLTELEKEVFLNNLKIMRDYRIQRAVNKIVYIHIIDHIIQVIKRERIKEFETIFCDKFWHILHSIENHVFTLKSSLRAEFSVHEDTKENKMIAKLEFVHGN